MFCKKIVALMSAIFTLPWNDPDTVRQYVLMTHVLFLLNLFCMPIITQ